MHGIPGVSEGFAIVKWSSLEQLQFDKAFFFILLSFAFRNTQVSYTYISLVGFPLCKVQSIIKKSHFDAVCRFFSIKCVSETDHEETFPFFAIIFSAFRLFCLLFLFFFCRQIVLYSFIGCATFNVFILIAIYLFLCEMLAKSTLTISIMR